MERLLSALWYHEEVWESSAEQSRPVKQLCHKRKAQLLWQNISVSEQYSVCQKIMVFWNKDIIKFLFPLLGSFILWPECYIITREVLVMKSQIHQHPNKRTYVSAAWVKDANHSAKQAIKKELFKLIEYLFVCLGIMGLTGVNLSVHK